MIQAKIEGIEYHLASKKENLKNLKENNPDWDVEKIFEKVGVKDRFISSERETSLSLGITAAKKFTLKILKEVENGLRLDYYHLANVRTHGFKSVDQELFKKMKF